MSQETPQYQHKDALLSISNKNSLQEKITALYTNLRSQNPDITRLAVALHDNRTDELKTFTYAAERSTPLPHYQFKLHDAFSLKQTLKKREPRLISDLEAFQDSKQPHTLALLDAGYRASYTLPMIINDRFLGFIFFNSDRKNAFNEKLMTELDMVGHLVTLLIYNERNAIRTLMATVKSALDLTHSRDPETGNHLERMSRYSRLIAQSVAAKYNLSDEFVEHIYLFSPLHDLGKLKTPDSVLLKPGQLDSSELQIMRQHPKDGLDIIDTLLTNYGLQGVGYVEVLRNIVLHHHESIDGSGYPIGLQGPEIPLEARIVTVADIFDALTSERPYKTAWSIDRAFDYLQSLADSKLDRECVMALISRRDEVEQIIKTFKENPIG
ncbi:MAG: HD domain-containing protein [Pseudomonadales bacterium]|nr:HD domain-containing protein [Pseudomonadales bacterium]